MKYIITIDRPCYPEVRTAETWEEAQNEKYDLLSEHDSEGDYEVKVIVAEIKELQQIKTTY